VITHDPQRLHLPDPNTIDPEPHEPSASSKLGAVALGPLPSATTNNTKVLTRSLFHPLAQYKYLHYINTLHFALGYERQGTRFRISCGLSYGGDAHAAHEIWGRILEGIVKRHVCCLLISMMITQEHGTLRMSLQSSTWLAVAKQRVAAVNTRWFRAISDVSIESIASLWYFTPLNVFCAGRTLHANGFSSRIG
jgi:hypothetical protein